ncbi:hypothetical protein V7103_21150 [Neobacillus drentensis]|uniref:hypothetical protein n=1 Tax=Neobacillus drentensis TaxID=220684 RepID=UPI002FFFD105
MKRHLIIVLLIGLILTGCGRDISSVESSMIGHWKETFNDGETGEIYISKDKFITVINGTKMTYEYKIVSENDKKKEISFVTKGAEDDSIKYEQKFLNKKMTKLNSTVDALNMKLGGRKGDETLDLIESLATSLNVDTHVTTKWKYVDGKTQP